MSMSFGRSKRATARKLLDDTGQAIKDIFRSRSPRPSSLSALEPDPGTSAPMTAGSISAVKEGVKINSSLINAGAIINTATPEQPLARSPTQAPTPTPQPSSAGPFLPSGPKHLKQSTTNANESDLVPPSVLPSAEAVVGQDAQPSQGTIVAGIPNPDAVAHAPEPSQSSGPASSNNQTKDTASAILRSSLSALRKCVDGVPTFKSVVDIMADCVDNIPAAAKHRNDYEALAEDLTNTVNSLQAHLNQVSPTQMADSIRNVTGALTELVNHVKEKQARVTARTYVEAERDFDDLICCYRRLDALFRQLHSDSVLSIWRITNQNFTIANEILVDNRLKGLSPVMMASYDSSAASQLGRGSCTPNTRLGVLEGLQNWASDPNGAKIYWMNGMAGTGKTTIAYSFCGRLKASHQLAASFFCSRSLPDCRDEARILPTISYQLARTIRPFQNILCRILGEDPDAGARNATTQFEKLVRDPLREIIDQIPAGLLVIVIDALDECSSPVVTLSTLDVLLRFTNDLPVKFFVTCRPEHNLLNHMASLHTCVPRTLYHLHDIEPSLVQADIETYLQVELEKSHISDERIKMLAVRSGKLFIYAATAVRYIRGQSALDDCDRIQAILEGPDPSSGSAPYKPLDTLYTAVLSAALENTELEHVHKVKIRLVLDTIICAREPLTIWDLSRLLHLRSAAQAKQAIEPLRSVIHLNEHAGLASTLHASFADYMLSSARSGRFYCNQALHSKLLAERCFEAMRRSLHFNVCGLESSYMRDDQVSDLQDRINLSIPSHLFYACRYWGEHSILADDLEELKSMMESFLNKQVLFWIEVMNLKQAAREGILALAKAYRWMKSSGMSDHLLVTCQDAQKFITLVSGNTVCKSTPHIYISVLALWDKADPMWMRYGTRTLKLTRITGTAIDNRESSGLAVWQHQASVFSVSVSPDGGLVASGSGKDYSVCIRDAQTGQIVAGPLSGHSGYVNSVSFSPDGARVASGSDDKTVRIWDVKTGQMVASPLEGHTGVVRSVAFSPDGNSITSGADDQTVCIWDTKRGRGMIYQCNGHNGCVCSVVYSSDGDFVASGSQDRSI
ncbi:hypothetical protein FRC12_008024 [Ceratobasidium sp. 428]|nr:hypothetical protein FRC12_008024 [Ceratobasidium sp. 428]